MLKARLIIIEPYGHQEVLDRWLPLLLDQVETVECWLSREIETAALCPNAMAHHSLRIAQPEVGLSFKSWLREKVRSIQKTDIILWLTTGLHYGPLLWLPKEARLLVLVHNVHTILRPKLHWQGIMRAWPSLLKYYATRQYIARRKLLQREPTLIFPSARLAQTANELGYPVEKLVVWPFSYSAGQLPINYPLRTTIVVPGGVKPRQRDYRLFKEVIEDWAGQHQMQARLVFLGQCKSEEFCREWSQFAAKFSNIEVICFKDAVPDDLYDMWMKKADLVVLPLKEQVTFGPFVERVESSKVSGGVYDALYYSKPLLIPSFYAKAHLPSGLTVAHYGNEKEGSEGIRTLLNSSLETRAEDGRLELGEQMRITLQKAHG